MIKYCIFDLDGTILNTITTITHFVNETLSAHGIEPITEDECKYFAGNGARLLIKRSLASKGIVDEEFSSKLLIEYNRAYDSNPLHLTGLFPGIYEMLAELKSHGIKLAVVSNKPDFAVRSVVEHFFPGMFDAIAGGKDGVPLKPDAGMGINALTEMGGTPEQTAWIGDTSTDIETGKNLKAAVCIGVLWGFRKRDELEAAGADVIVSEAGAISEEVLRFA